MTDAKAAVPKNSGTIRRIPVPTKKTEFKGDRSDATIAPSTTKPSKLAQGAAQGGLLQKNQHVSDALSRARESEETEKWDDDFALDISLPKLTRKLSPVPPEEIDTNHATVRPSRESLAVTQRRATKERFKSIEEDYSDLALEGDELKIKASIMKVNSVVYAVPLTAVAAQGQETYPTSQRPAQARDDKATSEQACRQAPATYASAAALRYPASQAVGVVIVIFSRGCSRGHTVSCTVPNCVNRQQPYPTYQDSAGIAAKLAARTECV